MAFLHQLLLPAARGLLLFEVAVVLQGWWEASLYASRLVSRSQSRPSILCLKGFLGLSAQHSQNFIQKVKRAVTKLLANVMSYLQLVFFIQALLTL